MRLCLAMVGALTVLHVAMAAPVLAQAPEVVEDVRSARYDRFSAFASTEYKPALVGRWITTTFFIGRMGDGPGSVTYWVARRVEGQGRSTEGSTVTWADSRRCDALVRVLEDMERLEGGWPDVPRLGRTEGGPPVLDGASITLWTRWARMGDGAALVEIEMRGNVDSPIAKWWSDMQASLAPCWDETEPPVDPS
jgi:hypothetical protein